MEVSATLAGISLPRDSHEQESFLTQDVTNKPRQRGDIVFWKGHVGIMVNAVNILHANAYHMSCVIEPLEVVEKRSVLPFTSEKA